ncbi:carbohydrate binding domain-containing protein [Pseudomonas sp.]|uniref:carbohydrate binding domain-containing protein n=1 Tax=Pseudomonas sp. TaxID=306 RepID=UPI003BB644D4
MSSQANPAPQALKQLYFPASSSLDPAEHYFAGIPIRAVEGDLQGIIAAYLTMSIGDLVEVFWGNADTAVWSKTIELDSELNQNVSFSIARGHVLEGDATPVFYRISRKNQCPEDSTPVQTLLVKLTRPGGYDDNTEDGHSDLNFSLDYYKVDDTLPAKGVTLSVVTYRNLTRYDRVLARCGSQQVVHVVTPEQAEDPIGHPIEIVFSRAVIEAAGDGRVAVAYQVIDRCGNYPDERAPWSAQQYLLVDMNGNRLDEPLVLVKGVPTTRIDLDTLGDDDVTARVLTTRKDFAVGDTVVLTWTGTSAQGLQIIVGPLEQTVDSVPSQLDFPIPNASVKAIAKGSASVGYVRRRPNQFDHSSRENSVSVIGDISPLAAPTVDEAPGGTLPPETPWATVNIPWYAGRRSSDLINLIWFAQAPDGDVYYDDPRPVGDVPDHEPVRRSVSNSEIKRFNSLSVKVYYVVTNSETALMSVRDSLPFIMQVGVALPTFDRPEVEEVEEADNGVLDPDKVPSTGATLVMTHLATQDKDRVTFRWRGSASDGSVSKHIDLIRETAGKRVRITVEKRYVTANLNGTVVADYSIQRDGKTLGHSHELLLSIGTALEEPDAPKIEQAPNGTSLDPMSALTDLIAVVDYDKRLGDQIIVTWTGAAGTLPAGSHTTTSHTVTTVEPQKIPLQVSVIAFSLGKSVTVSYTVTRGSRASVPSKTLTLAVLQLPTRELNTPKITDADANNVLDLVSLGTKNATIRAGVFPLIAVGQQVWMDLKGFKENGDEHNATIWDGGGYYVNNTWVGQGYWPKAVGSSYFKQLGHGTPLTLEFRVAMDKSDIEDNALEFPVGIYTITNIKDVKPTITNVTDSRGIVVQDGTTFDRSVTVFGTAFSGQKIRLYNGSDVLINEVTANVGGDWSQAISSLGITSYSLTALALYGSNQMSTPPRKFRVITTLERDFTDFDNENWNGWIGGPGVDPRDLALREVDGNWTFFNYTHTNSSDGVIIQKGLTHLERGRSYQFSIKAIRYGTHSYAPSLSIRAGGLPVAGPTQITSTSDWITLSGTFTASATSITVDIYSHVATSQGNDYQIDDIEILAL